MKILFTKMHALGNDFILIDATQNLCTLSRVDIQQLANRRRGIGFDQLLLIENRKSNNVTIDFHIRIFNADGSEAEQCCNGICCAALYLQKHVIRHQNTFRISTINRVLKLKIKNSKNINVDVGVPHFHPQDIPFQTHEIAHRYLVDVNHQSVKISVVNIGNPHAIIEVKRLNSKKVHTLGAALSQHKRFPKGVNVGFMQLLDRQHIRLRVYERGVGETLACGSAACAAMAVGRLNYRLQERVIVDQPGGSLTINWQGPGNTIQLTGCATEVFEGEWQS